MAETRNGREATVVSVRAVSLRAMGYNNLTEWLRNPNNVYIGRRNGYVEGTFQSKWHNPFKVADESERESCIAKYREYLHSKPELMAAIPELRGKTLGCWCAPKKCHGSVLLEELAKIEQKQVPKQK